MPVSLARMNVTVGFNDSPESIWAVLWAADEAARRFIPLHIVQYRDHPSGDAYWAGPNIGELVEGDTSPIDAARDLAQQHQPDLVVHTLVVDDNSHPTALSEQLEHTAMVVVGASAHPGIAGFWLGNTPRWLRRHTTCPVVVVRRPTRPQRPRRVVVGCEGQAGRAVEWACQEAALHGVPVTIVHISGGRQHSGVADDQLVLDAAVRHARRRCPTAVSGEMHHGDPADALLQACDIGDLLVMGTRQHGRVASAFLGSTVDIVMDHAHVPVVVVPEPAALTVQVTADKRAPRTLKGGVELCAL